MDCGDGLVIQSFKLNVDEVHPEQWYWEALCQDPSAAGFAVPSQCNTAETALDILALLNDLPRVKYLDRQKFSCSSGFALRAFTFVQDGFDGLKPLVKTIYTCCKMEIDLGTSELMWEHPGW